MKTYFTAPNGVKVPYVRPDSMSFQDYFNLFRCAQERKGLQVR